MNSDELNKAINGLRDKYRKMLREVGRKQSGITTYMMGEIDGKESILGTIVADLDEVLRKYGKIC